MIIKYDKIQFKERTLFGRVIAEPPTKNCASTTPEEAYLLYVKFGECWVYSEQEKTFLTKGQSIFLNGAYVGHLLPDKKTGKFEALSIRLHSSILEVVYKGDLPQFNLVNKNKQSTSSTKLEVNELISKFFDTITYYFEYPNLIQEEILTLKLKEAIILMLQTENADSIRYIFQNLFSNSAQPFQQIINAHIFSDISFEELAHLSNMSLSTFKRHFKKLYKTTPAQYFLMKRLEKARHLLEFSNLPIANIAFECAFKTPSHFSKKFKEYFNISPTEMKLTFSEQP